MHPDFALVTSYRIIACIPAACATKLDTIFPSIATISRPLPLLVALTPYFTAPLLVQPEPLPVQPVSLPVQPVSLLVQPEPLLVQPELLPVQSELLPVQPVSLLVQPEPLLV